MGLTIGSIGPINCRIDRSSVTRRVHVRILQSCAASSSAVAALVGRYTRSSFMKIVVITPARSSSRSGNQTTGARWTRILRELGHRVHTAPRYNGASADLMIAIHAWRSSSSIRKFRELYPDRPLIVALSGTDVYDYIGRDPTPTLRSLACADRLVALQELVRRRVPTRFRAKVRVVHQSAAPLRRVRRRPTRRFDVAVIGHLREVKDPFRAAKAARRLPASSRIRIVHLGAAETPRWAAAAKAEMAANPRYVWRGDRPPAFRCWPRASTVRLACLDAITRATFRSVIPKRWRGCSTGSRPTPRSSSACSARSRAALICFGPRWRRLRGKNSLTRSWQNLPHGGAGTGRASGFGTRGLART